MVIVRSGRSPFEVWMLVACFLIGIAGIVNSDTVSSVITSALPRWEVYAWYGGLIIGGGTSIVGTLRKGVISLVTERIGLVMLVCLTAAYSVSVLSQVGVRGTLPALFTGLFALACVVRAVEITTDLKRVEAFIPDRSEAGE